MIDPDARQDVLAAAQRLKMARSAHAYVRGNTADFYNWLRHLKRGHLPEGPPVWICGDCHVGNLGPLAHSDGRVEIQIRDLDQARTGDLKAPSWLWSSVVDLIAIHEKAYLEHCRLYALNEAH